MKTTMKNHEYLTKKLRSVRKITMTLLMASLIFSFASCAKEEIFEPDQKVHEVDEAVKATAKIVPDLSLEIRRITSNAKHVAARHRTVNFNGRFYSISSTILSSYNGVNWTILRKNTFPENVSIRSAVVHDGKIWAIGYSSTSRSHIIYSSRNGYSWSRPGLTTPPFSLMTCDGVVAFNNKMYVFAARDYTDGQQDVYSSSNGINWTLENAEAFPIRWEGTPVVFNDAMYFIGGQNNGFDTQSTIFKSTNGRDWSLVRAYRLLNSVAEDFPAKQNHAVVVHDNKVWVTGWGGLNDNATNGTDIWYSSDMKDWYKYSAHKEIKSLNRPTLLSLNDKMLLQGGIYYEGSWESPTQISSRYVWSIKPRRRVMTPVDRP